MEEENLSGYIKRIVFRNEENGYTVFVVEEADDDDVTCVGSFPFISEGEYVQLTGNMVSHNTYGEQFQVSHMQIKDPDNSVAMEKYLASGAIKGIGPALASRIVKKFKADTFRVIDEEPELLVQIKGISEKMAREIYAQFSEKRELRNAMLFLQPYGISTNLAVKIYKKYGERMYQVIRENPYRLAEDISGVGFKIADDIAMKAGLHTDSDYRIRAAVIYTLTQAASASGHVYLPVESLKNYMLTKLGIANEGIDTQLSNLAIEGKIVIKEEDGIKKVFSARNYRLELDTARMLVDLDIKYDIAENIVNERIAQIEKKLNIELDSMQSEAVKEAVKNGFFVLTGGPGTGKTTTINSIINFFEAEGLEILLAAPTGRAAKRMSETTKREARTIHRLLEMIPGQDDDVKLNFERNELNPLETDVVIIDETSMVDISLMYFLLKAISVGTRLILVGDENQLPSVGPGNVLHDIIASERFNVVRLNKIFRQASESDIILNAHKINAGEQIVMDNKSMDFFVLNRTDVNSVIGTAIALVRDKMPKYVNSDIYNIQVLTPTRKYDLGVENLNKVLQKYINPPSQDKKEKEFRGGIFREGDKVMQIKNNYQIKWEIRSSYGTVADEGEGIFNGDMGSIKQIDNFSEEMIIEFDDGRIVHYPFAQLEELELAYAVTIHKSQGSEYPAVVIPLLNDNPRVLFNRNILYTAVTRAKQCVTIVGSPDVVKRMIANVSETKRYTNLKKCIEQLGRLM